ncbi:MAG: glycosyltransferase, partial [Candidatus Doudnabacteria bacterium]
VDAAALARTPGARFALVGEGPLRAEVAARAEARGLAGRLALAGFRDDVPAILPDLDALVVTSRAEGLGSVVLEAFASGVPVVATRAGGLPELVVDGETGLLADPGDAGGIAAAIDRILSDSALRARLVENGRSAARARSAPALAAATLAIYREIL